MEGDGRAGRSYLRRCSLKTARRKRNTALAGAGGKVNARSPVSGGGNGRARGVVLRSYGKRSDNAGAGYIVRSRADLRGAKPRGNPGAPDAREALGAPGSPRRRGASR